jgi:hypothetical protein
MEGMVSLKTSIIAGPSRPVWSAALKVVVVALISYLALTLLQVTPNPRYDDSIKYWSAFQRASRGENPYSFQENIGPVWNPPIMFVILRPLLALPFEEYNRALLSFAIIGALLSGLLTWWTITRKTPEGVYWILGAVLSLPLAATMVTGQLSMIITLASAAACALYFSGFSFIAGCAASVLFIKPHMVFLLLAMLAMDELRFKRARFLLGLIGSLAFWIGLSWAIYPGLWTGWLNRDRWPTEILGGTLVAAARQALFINFGTPGLWLTIALPLMSMIILASFLALMRDRIRTERIVYLVIAISAFVAPYGFVFDQTTLILSQVALIAMAVQSGERAPAAWILAVLAVTFGGGILMAQVEIWSLPLWWFLSPLSNLFLWAYMLIWKPSLVICDKRRPA